MTFLDSLFKRGGDKKEPTKETSPGAEPALAAPQAAPPPAARPAKPAEPSTAKKPMGLEEIMAVLQQIDAVINAPGEAVGALRSLSRKQVQIVHGLGMALGYRFSGVRGA